MNIVMIVAATQLGCLLGGAALVLGMGGVALFSRHLADLMWPAKPPRLITDRHAPDGDALEARRGYNRVGRWILLIWGAAGAISGFLLLVGVLDCG